MPCFSTVDPSVAEQPEHPLSLPFSRLVFVSLQSLPIALDLGALPCGTDSSKTRMTLWTRDIEVVASMYVPNFNHLMNVLASSLCSRSAESLRSCHLRVASFWRCNMDWLMGKTNPGDMILSVDGQHLIVRFSEYGLGRFHIQWSCRGISKEFELNFLSSLHWSEDGG